MTVIASPTASSRTNFRVLKTKSNRNSPSSSGGRPCQHGVVIDNSGSMRDKRPASMKPLSTLVQASNPKTSLRRQFQHDFYLDLGQGFTNSIPELQEALERIDSRPGSTALRTPILRSLDHLKKASKDKKILPRRHRREDNASRNSLEKMIREVQEDRHR